MSSAPRQSPFRTRPAARGAVQYEVRAAGGTDAEILLYDEIGFWGVQAKEFVRDIGRITAGTIHLRINSPGGDVFDGTAIANALTAHPARIVTHIDALAASIASVIALAGDEVIMAPNAFLMIHDPFALTVGNAAELRKTADTLDKVAGNILDCYVARSGEDADTVRAWMREETWFTAAEAVDAGFADAITAGKDESKLAAAFDLSIYCNAPPALRTTAEEPHSRRTDRIAAGASPTIRDTERALRDAGFSRSDATAIAARGFPALQRDAGDVPDAATLAACDRLLAALQPA